MVTGGQSGADVAAWRAARAAGLLTSGWMPAGYLTEDGPRPGYAEEFGALCLDGPAPSGAELGRQYAARRRMNAAWADCALLLGDAGSRGGRGLVADCRALGVPLLHCGPGGVAPSVAADWVLSHDPLVLLVAGNRGSAGPDVEPRAGRFVLAVLRALADADATLGAILASPPPRLATDR